MVEHSLGKGEVGSSILPCSTIPKPTCMSDKARKPALLPALESNLSKRPKEKWPMRDISTNHISSAGTEVGRATVGQEVTPSASLAQFTRVQFWLRHIPTTQPETFSFAPDSSIFEL